MEEAKTIDLLDRLQRIEHAVARTVRKSNEDTDSSPQEEDGKRGEPVTKIHPRRTGGDFPEFQQPAVRNVYDMPEYLGTRNDGIIWLEPTTLACAGEFEGLTHASGCWKYVGASSPLVFGLTNGPKWVDAKLGDNAFSKLLGRAWKALDELIKDRGKTADPDKVTLFSVGRMDVLRDPPDAASGLHEHYIEAYFREVNRFFPIFTRQRFDNLYASWRDGKESVQKDARDSCVAIVLALGAQTLASTPSAFPNARADSWAFFHRAASYIPRFCFSLTMWSSGIATVRALVGMAIFLGNTDDHPSSNTLLGLAAANGTVAGFHRDGLAIGLKPSEASEYKNIFWTFYVMDKGLALRTGRPTSLTDLDIDVQLPSESNDVGGYLRHAALLGRIQSSVGRLLYSSHASQMTMGALRGLMEAMKLSLEQWKSGCHLVNLSLPALAATGIEPSHWRWIVRLRLSYFETLGSIYHLFIWNRDAYAAQHSAGLDKLIDYGRADCDAIILLIREGILLPAPRIVLQYLLMIHLLLFTSLLSGAEGREEDLSRLKRLGDVPAMTWWPPECRGVLKMYEILTVGIYDLASKALD